MCDFHCTNKLYTMQVNINYLTLPSQIGSSAMSKKLRAAHGDLLSNLHVLVPLGHARGPTSLDSISVWKWLITSNLSISCSIQLPQDANLNKFVSEKT